MSVKTAVLLAAGKGERMLPLTKDKPKFLLDYAGVTILRRSIYQLINSGIKKIIIVAGYQKDSVVEELKQVREVEIIIVENVRYEEDGNIYSLLLAMEHISEDFLLLEADILAEDGLYKFIIDNDFNHNSVWFTQGVFREGQYGGILKADPEGNAIDIRIVPEFDEKYDRYMKLTGIMRISKNQIARFKQLLVQYTSKSIEHYYLIPWIENLDVLPAVKQDISFFDFATFNKPEEYFDIINHKTFNNRYNGNGIHLIEVWKLRHIEGFSNKKVKHLKQKILNEGSWKWPICVEKNHWLVLDGQHRLEVAKSLGLKTIPSQLFNYSDVNFWSLRDNHKVSINSVCERAISGNIYPYKTVKHDFSESIQPCEFELEKLK